MIWFFLFSLSKRTISFCACIARECEYVYVNINAKWNRAIISKTIAFLLFSPTKWIRIPISELEFKKNKKVKQLTWREGLRERAEASLGLLSILLHILYQRLLTQAAYAKVKAGNLESIFCTISSSTRENPLILFPDSCVAIWVCDICEAHVLFCMENIGLVLPVLYLVRWCSNSIWKRTYLFQILLQLRALKEIVILFLYWLMVLDSLNWMCFGVLCHRYISHFSIHIHCIVYSYFLHIPHKGKD